jgi:amidase
MKPTHGLVPCTGIMPIEIYVDHTGPITANVTDNALLLEVIAEGNVSGLRIGMVKEGFGHSSSEKDVTPRCKRRRSS